MDLSSDRLLNELYITIEGRPLDKIEKFHIYDETRKNNQINKKCTVKPKVVFETVISEDTNRVHLTL